MASEHRLIEFFEIFREGCFQGDFFFGIFSAEWKKGCLKSFHQLEKVDEI